MFFSYLGNTTQFLTFLLLLSFYHFYYSTCLDHFNLYHVQFGLPSFITSYNAKPVLLRNTSTFLNNLDANYAEVDVNVHQFSSLPKKALSILLSQVRTYTFNMSTEIWLYLYIAVSQLFQPVLSGTLESPYLLLSYPTVALASHIATILTFTLQPSYPPPHALTSVRSDEHRRCLLYRKQRR